MPASLLCAGSAPVVWSTLVLIFLLSVPFLPLERLPLIRYGVSIESNRAGAWDEISLSFFLKIVCGRVGEIYKFYTKVRRGKTTTRRGGRKRTGGDRMSTFSIKGRKKNT